MTVKEFGESVKAKYSQYSWVDSEVLGKRMLEKYPQYRDKVQVEKESIGNKILKVTSPFRQIAWWVASSVGTFWAKAVWSALKGWEYIGEKLWQAQEKIFWLDKAVTPTLLKWLWQRTVERATQAEWTIQKKFWQDIQGKPLTEISKWITDIAQTVAIWPKAPTFWKAWISTIGKVFSKEWAKQVWRAALQWAAEWAIYSAWAEGKVDPTTVWVSAWLEAAFPVVWLWVKAASKWLAWSAKKLAAKLETSGIMNPAKFDTIKSRLIEEWVDQGKNMKPDDVANWMLQRWLKWSPEDMAEQAFDVSTKSQEAKKWILQLSEWTYTPKEAKFVIDDMLKELKWSASDEFRELYGKLSLMKTKLQKSWLTLADLDFIRGKAWDVLNPFTASGKVIRSAKDTKNVISWLKKFIEKTADAEWLSAKAWYEGKHIIRDLNNQTAIAKEVWDAILRKESTSATAEIISFLASKWWSMLWWGILWSQAWPFNSNTIEGKVWNILLGALWWSLVSNTRVKSNLANFLNKASWAEKSALYERMKSRWSKEATAWVKKMINSVSAILSKQTTNDLRPMRSPVISPANSNVDSSILSSRTSGNAPSWTAKVVKPWQESWKLFRADPWMYKENKNMILGIKDKKPEPRLLSAAKPSDFSTELVKEAKKYKSFDDFVDAKMWGEYKMSHRPSEWVRSYDLIEKVDWEQMIPKNMYEVWHWSRGTREDLESIAVLKRIKWNPEAEVTIYRASPSKDFNYGDWVTFSPSYAKWHAESNGSSITSKVVKAKDVKWAMDDINEFGYYPEWYKEQLRKTREEAKK